MVLVDCGDCTNQKSIRNSSRIHEKRIGDLGEWNDQALVS
ncbi:hypothetical protein P872_10940 [Rhodonellum psychrophilum GCM71 = DSM 17998]|uniref:Uncharacterized protein n=1 Tax=Rhodonellum psychrophilum GCM71 = DSM 17998 TaxID=1123057 RepID=U5BYI6_9BACT|nr:hypothetical protein P872_10940 [Rhodonellum psychrophilum GCM71 = DSM 17998]